MNGRKPSMCRLFIISSASPPPPLLLLLRSSSSFFSSLSKGSCPLPNSSSSCFSLHQKKIAPARVTPQT